MDDKVRLIDADKLLKTIANLDVECADQKQASIMLNTIQKVFPRIVNDEPTADVQSVEQDTELSIILQDYGIKDTDTLRYILDQYQKVIVEITHGRLSKLTYPADTIVNMEENVSREYWEKELVKHGKWLINCDGYYPYCSNCKEEPQGREMTDYCPNCGAKMDLKDGGSEWTH